VIKNLDKNLNNLYTISIVDILVYNSEKTYEKI